MNEVQLAALLDYMDVKVKLEVAAGKGHFKAVPPEMIDAHKQKLLHVCEVFEAPNLTKIFDQD